MRIYLIGSLRNPISKSLANKLRREGHDIFDDWSAVGPEADDWWMKYEKARGNTYKQALDGYAAKHVYEFDKHNIDQSQVGLLVLPAGKSAHLELGYMIGCGKPGIIYYEDEPERWDVMYQFASKICIGMAELHQALRELKK